MPDRGDEGQGPVRVRRAQVLRRRARLRVAKHLARDDLIDLANRLAQVAGVDRVLARPGTGSLIVETHRPAAEVVDDMEAGGLIKCLPALHRPPVRTTVQMGLVQADYKVKKGTHDQLDLRTALGLVLLAAAMLQLTRGRVAGPATTLALAAFTLLDASRDKR